MMFEKFLRFVTKHTRKLPKMAASTTSVVANIGFIGLAFALAFGTINEESKRYIRQSINIQLTGLVYMLVLILVYYLPIIRLLFPIALIIYRLIIVVMFFMGIGTAGFKSKKGVWFMLNIL